MVWFWNNSANKAVLAVISISSLPANSWSSETDGYRHWWRLTGEKSQQFHRAKISQSNERAAKRLRSSWTFLKQQETVSLQEVNVNEGRIDDIIAMSVEALTSSSLTWIRVYDIEDDIIRNDYFSLISIYFLSFSIYFLCVVRLTR